MSTLLKGYVRTTKIDNIIKTQSVNAKLSQKDSFLKKRGDQVRGR